MVGIGELAGGAAPALGLGQIVPPVAAVLDTVLAIKMITNNIQAGHRKNDTARAQQELDEKYKQLSQQVTAARQAGTLTPEALGQAQEAAINGWNGLAKFLSEKGSAGANGLKTMSWVPKFLSDLGLPAERIAAASTGKLWPDNGGGNAAMTSSFTNTGPDLGSLGAGAGGALPGIAGILGSLGAGITGALTGKSRTSSTPTSSTPNDPKNPSRGQQIAQLLLSKGIPIAGTLLSSLMANKQTPQEEDALAQLIAGNKASQEAGTKFLDMATGPIKSAEGFWQSILNQGRPNPTALLGPEIRSESDRYDETLKAQRELAPRSGMAGQRASDLPFEKATAVTTLYQKLLQDRETERNAMYAAAPAGLASLGTNMANIGISGLTGGQAGAGTLLDYESGRRKDATGFGVNTGTSLAKIIFG